MLHFRSAAAFVKTIEACDAGYAAAKIRFDAGDAWALNGMRLAEFYATLSRDHALHEAALGMAMVARAGDLR